MNVVKIQTVFHKNKILNFVGGNSSEIAQGNTE